MRTDAPGLIDRDDSSVIDFKTAATRITTDRIAAAILHIAANESIRVIEALASAIVNALKSGTEVSHPFVFGRTRLLRYPSTITAEDSPKIAAIRRIARRALSETLADPTLGATAFHRIETTPAWSKNSLPVAVFGSFLFYRL